MNSASCRSLSSRFSSSSGFLVTSPASARVNSMPITARVCSNSFSAAGSRSMREAMMSCTVGGTFSAASGRVSLTAPLRTSAPSSVSACTISSMKRGVAFCLLNDQSLERGHLAIDRLRVHSEQYVEHLGGRFLAQRVEAKLGVVALGTPRMRILRAVVHQQQNLGGPD